MNYTFQWFFFFFPLQVVSIYMIVLVTIKGNRKNTHKRYTKSEKIILSDYFIFCNNFFFFSEISKKGYADSLDFAKGAKSVSFFSFPSIFDDVCRLREKCQALWQFPRAWRPVCLESGAGFHFPQISLMPYAGYSIFGTQQKHLQNKWLYMWLKTAWP